ncbi:xylulokinase [Rhodoferax sp. OV413]|uniref:FGGY-family carbohydrate kinase n=1 Tax=Rhodoferax sp. OV413 TaxID=1855285 RepID=UPI00088E657E|nr:FGGY-family carbohydrate kinase [Rhodoferax sp. OV413]SDP22459.1 xylulokinase [Rhodoferax sp. OV413]
MTSPMTARDCVIGVDIGTQSTKAVLVRADGTILAQYAQSYQVETPKPLWAQQWPDVWLDAVVTCINGVLAQVTPAQAAIKSICVSSLYGGSGIPVDARGEALYPCLIWMDRRAQDEVHWVRDHVDLERLFDITGNGVDSYYGYTKMLWLREKEPAVWAKTQQFLPPNSYVNARLTGEVAVDHSSAGNIGGVYDVKARSWSTEALEMLGIPHSMMPARLVESSGVVGPLLPAWAERLGLPAGIPVVAGGVDAAVATLAAGAAQPGNHVAMIGTSMCWGTVRPSVDARHGLISMPHVFNGGQDLYVFGGAIAAGASVTWFRETFCQAEVAAGKALGVDPHSLLEKDAVLLPPGSDGLLFLPYLMGERSPVWDAQASGSFVGLGLHHGRPHLYRAVLEGVTYALRHNIEAGVKGIAQLDERLVVVGGASHSDMWMQIIADVTGRPVYTLADDVEASLGAAMLAAFGAGLIDADAVRRGWVTPVLRTGPDAAAHAAYNDLFAQYVDLYPTLKPAMHRLRRTTQGETPTR